MYPFLRLLCFIAFTFVLQINLVSADRIKDLTSLAGINFYTSPQVIDGSDSTEKKGAIYAQTALGCGYIDFGGGNFIQLETQRQAAEAGTDIVANGYWEIAETVDLHGVEIFTEIS